MDWIFCCSEQWGSPGALLIAIYQRTRHTKGGRFPSVALKSICGVKILLQRRECVNAILGEWQGAPV